MTKISRIEAIQALKKKFFNTNPESWSQNSNTELSEWYAEHILQDTSKAIKVVDNFFYFFDSIKYRGIKYPTRTLTVTSDDTGEQTYTIADETLFNAISEDDKYLDGGTAEHSIDEMIYFYVEEGCLELPAEEICKDCLDEEFEFVSE